MKKIILTALFFSAVPAFAACSITGGACTISNSFSDLSLPSLESKYAPSYLNDIQRPDAFNSIHQNPYTQEIDTGSQNVQSYDNMKNYDPSCQFGVCLEPPMRK